MIQNIFAVEFNGRYVWSAKAPIHLLELAENNLHGMHQLEEFKFGSMVRAEACYFILSCRIERPAALPGRPGLVYHHCLVAPMAIDEARLADDFRRKYSAPIAFTVELYKQILELGSLNDAQMWESLAPLLLPVTVEFAADKDNEGPAKTSSRPGVHQTLLNLPIYVQRFLKPRLFQTSLTALCAILLLINLSVVSQLKKHSAPDRAITLPTRPNAKRSINDGEAIYDLTSTLKARGVYTAHIKQNLPAEAQLKRLALKIDHLISTENWRLKVEVFAKAGGDWSWRNGDSAILHVLDQELKDSGVASHKYKTQIWFGRTSSLQPRMKVEVVHVNIQRMD